MSADTTYFLLPKPNNTLPDYNKSGFVFFIDQEANAYSESDTSLIDSTLKHPFKVIKPDVFKKSLLNNIPYNNSTIKPEPISVFNTDWLSYLLICAFIVYVFIKKNFYIKQRLLFNSFFDARTTGLLIREGNLYKEKNFYALIALSFISISFLFLNLGIYFFNTKFIYINSFYFFYKLIAVFIVFYFGKVLLMLMLSNIFKLSKIYSDFVLMHHVYIIVFGIFSLFFSLFVFYTSHKIIIILSALASLSLFLNYLFRLYKLHTNAGYFSIFYFFLYICTLEIMPLLIIYKLLNK